MRKPQNPSIFQINSPICCLNYFPRVVAKTHLMMVVVVVRATAVTVLLCAGQRIHTPHTHPVFHVVLMQTLTSIINSG